MSDVETLETCAGCGATIYPEHLASRKAERMAGKVYCVHCVRERTAASTPAPSVVVSATVAPSTASAGDAAGAVPAEPARKTQITFERTTNGRRQSFRRPMSSDPAVATRCRVFHCRLNDAAIRSMEDQINEWADSDDSIHIRYSTSAIGPFDGKATEPHLILTVFY
jgi:hypothetical protein